MITGRIFEVEPDSKYKHRSPALAYILTFDVLVLDKLVTTVTQGAHIICHTPIEVEAPIVASPRLHNRLLTR